MARFTVYQNLRSDDGTDNYTIRDSKTGATGKVRSMGQAAHWALAVAGAEAAMDEGGEDWGIETSRQRVL